MEVDILIDKIIDCLIDTRTEEEVETEYRMRGTPIRPKDYKGWKFNWSITEKNGYHIYELFLKGDDTVQGFIQHLHNVHTTSIQHREDFHITQEVLIQQSCNNRKFP